MSDTKSIQARIEGRVQGVWFRAWTQGEARARGLIGWVRNESDGAVRGVFAGPSEAVEDMVRALHQGPPSAEVISVNVSPADWPDAEGFDILR